MSQKDFQELLPDVSETGKIIPIEPLTEESEVVKSFMVELNKITHTTMYARQTRKYIRVEQGSGSIYAFIDRMTGDLLFPASWQAPTKHSPIRGNIFNGTEGCEKYSLKYLR